MSKFGKRLSYFGYFLKNAPWVMLQRINHRRKNTSSFRGTRGLSIESTDAKLSELLEQGKPFCAIRFGAVELSCLNNHEKIELGLKKTYKDLVRFSMKNNAGFYPTGDRHLKEYGDRFLSELRYADYLGVSGVHMEDYFHRHYCPDSKPILYEGMEPLRGHWTSKLAGKKVLVITPFVEEVEAQYAKRAELFKDDPSLLPEFELKLIRSPMTLGDVTPPIASFFRGLEEMEMAMDRTDFDVLLVGAGAYGTFLAIHAKRIGKMAIQTGGATMTLFGIMGKRWENREHVTKHVNDSWIRPYEKPLGYQKIEQGAYW